MKRRDRWSSARVPNLRGWVRGAGLALLLSAAGMPATLMGQGQEGEGFRPITLDEAIEIAMRRNPGLSQARTNIETAEHTRLSAVGSLLPQLSMSYGYSNSSSGRLDATAQSIVTTSYTTQLTGTYNLFDGWRRFSDLKGARLGVLEQNARYRETEFQTVQQVKQAYFNAVAAREVDHD